jgi:hypothetical protein
MIRSNLITYAFTYCIYYYGGILLSMVSWFPGIRCLEIDVIYPVKGYEVRLPRIACLDTMPKIAVQLFRFSPLAFLPSQQLGPACASFLLPFPDIVVRLLYTLLDMLDLGCHVAIDLFEEVDEFYKLFGGSRREAWLWTGGSTMGRWER